jgi:hypothetical protein
MTTRFMATALTTVTLLAACGGDAPPEQETALGVADSLVPIADEPMLPDTTPPAPAETVFVDRPAPPPATRPVTRTPPPPPATRPAPTPATPPAAAPTPAPAMLALASGTALRTTVLDSIHSRHNAVGDAIRVRVAADYTDGNGRVVIPAGSIITMAIIEIAPAPNRGDAGTLVLSARSVAIGGESFPLVARSTDFEYELRARGVGTGEVAKTGAGAVAGGIIGRVIGGKKGTVVGAIGGAAAGAAVASSTADRDIIVGSGKPMTITLRDEFDRPAS